MSATETTENVTEKPDGSDAPGGHLGHLAAKGALWSVLTNVVAAPLNLIAIGSALEMLGRDRYGVWAMIAVLGNFIRLGDFGLSSSFARLVAERLATRDFVSLSRGLSTVTTIVFTITAVVTLSAWLARDWILFGLFRIPSAYAWEAVPAFGIMLMAMLITLQSPCFASLLVGAQRTDREKQITGGANIVLSSGILLALALDAGVRGIAIAQFVSSAGGFLTLVLVARRVVPDVALRPLCGISDLSEAYRLVRFGAGLQLTQTAMQMMTQADRLILSHYIGVGVAGAYDAALKAVYTLQGATNHLISPLYAAAARLKAEAREGEIRNWIVRSGRIFSALAVPAYGLICAGAPAIVQAWIGRPDSRIAVALSVVAAVQAINSGTGPGYFMLLGTGRLRPILLSSLLAAVVGISIGWGTVNVLGYGGVVLAHSAGVAILCARVSLSIRAAFGTSLLQQFRTSLIPFLVGLAEGGALMLVAPHLPSSRLLTLLIAVLLFFPGFLLLWRVGFLTADDRQFILRFLPGRASLRRVHTPAKL